MKITLLRSLAGLSILLSCWLPAKAQSVLPFVLASTGGTGLAPGGTTLNFTVGEPFTSTIGTSPQFTEGFQQPSTSGNPLPVRLLDFNGVAKSGYSLLNWRTSQEINNDYFNVERSRDGIAFQAIGKVYSLAVNGNSNGTLAYTLIDKTMSPGINYYRLQQVDKDKQSSYSMVISLDNSGPAQSFSLSPNPARNKLYLLLTTVGEHSQIQITDVSGREIKSLQLTNVVTEMDISGLATGTYFVRYTDGQNSESIKVVKE